MNLDEDSQYQVRELGQEEDLELIMDQDRENQDRDLQSRVIFSTQGLGGVRTLQNGLNAYIKGTHCQQSIKDLVKMIRRDSPNNPKVKIILANFNLFESDLIDLLMLQLQDKKLSFWLLALMATLTEQPSQLLEPNEKTKLQIALRAYKKASLRKQFLNSLTIHISDYFTTPVQQRKKAHLQMMQFIILLIRNLTQIRSTYSEYDDDQYLHQHFLVHMIKQQMFQPLLYLVQAEKNEQLLSKIDLALLQIFYFTFTCLNPSKLYKKDAKTLTSKDWQNLLNTKKKFNVPLRHSRFLPNFHKSGENGVKTIVHNLNKKPDIKIKQRNIPLRVADLKKINQIQMHYLGQNFMEMQYQSLGHESHSTRIVRDVVFDLAQQFVEVQFAMISKLVFNLIYRQNAQVTQTHVVQYMLLCNWAIEMTRKKFHKKLQQAKTPQQKGEIQLQLVFIANVLDPSHFELIYKNLFREVTREKKKDFKINMFNGALKMFLGYLSLIEDMSVKSHCFSDRSNANKLMGHMFRHDIARIFKIGFSLITSQDIIATLIVVTHKFFYLLSNYSKGKVLTIKTNKMLKRKNKKRVEDEDQDQLAGFISEDSADDGQQSYKQGDQQKQKPVKKQKPIKQNTFEDQPMFIQRKFNEISQFSIVAEYNIISKYLIFLKSSRFLQNTDEFNGSLFFYFERILKLLKGQWLFFQAQTLYVFQQILAQQKFCRDHPSWTKPIVTICQQFIKLLKLNKLAVVESLFRYGSLSIRDKILKNYEEIDEYQQEFEKGSIQFD